MKILVNGKELDSGDISAEQLQEFLSSKQDKLEAQTELKEIAKLVLGSSCPTNHILYDDVGKGGTYVYIPKFRLCDVMSTSDTSVHPAFVVNGQEIPGFYIGKFQSSVSNSRAYSLPVKDPAANVSFDTAISQNRNKGGNFHEVTVAEWSAIALWCHKNGTESKGNNDFGKDVSETLYKAVPSLLDSGKTARVATGTGPVTWSHDGTLEGVWDMNGNVWQWCTGLRLVHGELQVIPYNDSSDPTCDLSATSAAWKAIKAAATSWDDLFVTPDGNGTTQGTVKLDWDGTKWVYSTTIAHATKTVGCSFASVTADASIGDQAKLLLMALTMMPDLALTGDGIAADYNGDHFYVNNADAERCLRRGGCWFDVGGAGVFSSHLNGARSASGRSIGGRSAYYET